MSKLKVRSRVIDSLGMYRSAEHALVELAANSHDAEAKTVKFTLTHFMEQPQFIIEDTGLGMTKDELENE